MADTSWYTKLKSQGILTQSAKHFRRLSFGTPNDQQFQLERFQHDRRNKTWHLHRAWVAKKIQKGCFSTPFCKLSEDEFKKLNHVKQPFLWIPNMFHRSLDILNQLDLKGGQRSLLNTADPPFFHRLKFAAELPGSFLSEPRRFNKKGGRSVTKAFVSKGVELISYNYIYNYIYCCNRHVVDITIRLYPNHAPPTSRVLGNSLWCVRRSLTIKQTKSCWYLLMLFGNELLGCICSLL